MPILHDAPGRKRWITVTEEYGIRYLLLDGCEEGAMSLDSEAPVFQYLWFHKASRLVERPVHRAAVLGAGAFTAAKCLALDHAGAVIDAVDEEPELEPIALHFFRLDRPEFSGIRFFGIPAEDFLAEARGPYDFIFDDLFQGFQHVPARGRGPEHFSRLQAVLSEGGVCIKNLIWDVNARDTQVGCTEAESALAAAFPGHAVLALGSPTWGHNRILIGRNRACPLDRRELRQALAMAGVPAGVLERCQFG
jgi:hypothetical protein